MVNGAACAKKYDEIIEENRFSNSELDELLRSTGAAKDSLEYALLLLKGSQLRQKEAINILKRLSEGEIANDMEQYVEIVYNLCLGLYSLGKYEESRHYCDQLMSNVPENRQVRELHLAIMFKMEQNEVQVKKENKEKAIAIGIAGVAVVAAVGAIAIGLSKRKK